ncbi:hypothetical protein [Paraburkholderia dipogonis]|uniref:hypothetical protein n=1 Tax=Paraburkholderia dipogonis TaxID=1211383 RepID=UPI0038BAEEFC
MDTMKWVGTVASAIFILVDKRERTVWQVVGNGFTNEVGFIVVKNCACLGEYGLLLKIRKPLLC